MKKQKTSAPRTRPLQKTSGTPAKVTIHQLPTGVRGLDEILGGGIPEFSFNIIAGTPGCGKTTLAHQIIFANATPKKPALYFTVLGEPAIKMLRYQQQYSFFDEAKLGQAIRFINLSDAVAEHDLTAVLEEIIKQVTAAKPGIVVVDSFRTVVRKAVAAAADRRIRPGRGPGQSGVHGRRRAHLALPNHGAKFRGPKIADHQGARPGLRAGFAHLPYRR